MTCRRVPWVKHDTLVVSPCVAGNQDADNLHGDDLHDQGRLGAAKAIRAGPLARIRSRKSADGEPVR